MRENTFKGIHLKWKIFGFLLGFCGLMLVILWLFQTVFLNDTYKLIRRHEMNEAIALVSKNIDSSDLQAVFDTIIQEKDILVDNAAEFKVPERIRPNDRNKPRQETLTKTKVFTRADGSELTLTFHAMITPVNATVATLTLQLKIITGVMIILSVLMALLIARHVSKPIEEINKSAKSLAKGDYETGFHGRGFVEIEELSHTLNTTACELSKVEGFRRELMTNIAHDLRTPLSLIYSYAEMMHDFPDEISQEQTQIIMDEASRLSSLVNDVFEISKLETGVQTLNASYYNLTEQIGAIIKRMEELVKKDGYIFEFQADNEILANADEVKIAQVIYNLLINAIHYTGGDKKIIVRQTVEGNHVKVEVIDHGEGICAEDLPYIWNRYYKVDKKHKRAVTGTGLGLSIVKNVVQLHKGNYGVESEVGGGSDFWFKIPYKREEPVN